jgi:hypothetical protein
MDTLTEQWILYCQDQRIADDALQVQIAAILSEIPAIELRDYSDQERSSCFDLSVPKLNYDWCNITSNKELYKQLQVVQERWQEYQAQIAQSQGIIAQNPGIKVEESGDDTWWKVSVPDAGWRLQNPARNAHDFLAQVKMAAKVWQQHEKELQCQDGFLMLARDLARTIPGMRVREEPHPYSFHKIKWYVDHKEFSVALGWALSAEEFYKNVKEVYRLYSELHDNTEPVDEQVTTAEGK